MYFYYDWTYILVLIGAVLSLWASAGVRTTYSKYAKVTALNGITGVEAAERILHNAGIYNVRVERVSGRLTDHYDSSAKVLRLSAWLLMNAVMRYRIRNPMVRCDFVIRWFRL